MASSAAGEINRTIKRLGQKTNCCVGHKIKRYILAIYMVYICMFWGMWGAGQGRVVTRSCLQKLMMCQAVDPRADTAAVAAVSGFIVVIEVGQLVLSWLRKLLSSCWCWCCCWCCHRLQLVHTKLISELYVNAAKGSNTDHLATLLTWLLVLCIHTSVAVAVAGAGGSAK